MERAKKKYPTAFAQHSLQWWNRSKIRKRYDFTEKKEEKYI